MQESLSPSGIETLKENINRKINELSWDIEYVQNELADLIAEDGIMGHNYKGFIRSKRIRLAQLKDELNYYNSPDAYAGKKAAEMQEELTRVQEEQQKLESAKNSIAPKVVQVVAVVISAAVFAVSAYYYYKQMKAEHNIEQLPRPHR